MYLHVDIQSILLQCPFGGHIHKMVPGLSMPAAKKRCVYPTTVIAASIERDFNKTSVAALSVDCNAELRSCMPYNPTYTVGGCEMPWTVEMMVDQVFLPHLFRAFSKGGSELRYVALCFDDGSRNPAMRERFYRLRRYAPVAPDATPPSGYVRHEDRFYRVADVPISDDRVSAITPVHMPGSWSAVLNSGRGKKRLFEIIAAVFRRRIQDGRGVPSGALYVIDINGERWVSYPSPVFDMDPNPLNYGEGDSKSVWWAARFASRGHRSMLVTIDWDLPVMLLLWNMPDVIIKISRVYVPKAVHGILDYDAEHVMLTKQKALATFGTRHQSASELVVVSKTQDSVGGGADCTKMHHMVFVLLCSASCDYNLSLNALFTPKFTEGMLTMFMKDPECASFLKLGTVANPSRRTLEFLPASFIQFVRRAGMPKIRNESIEAFTEEIHSILYCITYFAGWDAGRTPAGGPAMPDFTRPLFGAAKTLTGLLTKVPALLPSYTLAEEHPLDIRSLPFAPQMLYSGEHIEKSIAMSTSAVVP